VKKSFVFLLLALAVVVLISPGIVGRLAEEAMDEALDRAATQSQEFRVTSSHFKRSWFSSEGQHRVEIRDTELRESLLALAQVNGLAELPTLIIDTHIDHGIVPVTSVGRERGSLAPGLGSAVSSLSLEFDSGSMIELPATVYSEVGLTGQLASNLVMGPGSFNVESETAEWGDVDVAVTVNPMSSLVGFAGAISHLSLLSPYSELTFSNIEFSGEQEQTRFGFAVGDFELAVETIAYPSNLGPAESGPWRIRSSADLDDDLVSGQTQIDIDYLAIEGLGPTAIGIDAALTDVDAASISRISRTIDEFDSYGSRDDLMIAVSPDLETLFATGFELDVERLDLTSPTGTIAAKIDVDVAPTDVDRFEMTSSLLAAYARLDLELSEQMFDYLAAINPEAATAAAMGFLRRNGNVYEMVALLENGKLTVNGAPMPLPLQSGN
jgi:uncharacterized protein YdgA (DUF945 family)